MYVCMCVCRQVGSSGKFRNLPKQANDKTNNIILSAILKDKFMDHVNFWTFLNNVMLAQQGDHKTIYTLIIPTT